MGFQTGFPAQVASWLARHRPDDPVFLFSPAALRRCHAFFQRHFPGEVTYAVKANPDRAVLETLPTSSPSISA